MMNLNNKGAKNVEAVTHTHTHTHTLVLENKKEEIKNNKNIYSCNEKNCMGGCFCGFKKQTAITLIALIITIIVLLILAGVTLNAVIGNDGIIAKAQLAKEKTNQSQNEEQEKLSKLENETEKVLTDRGTSDTNSQSPFKMVKLGDGTNVTATSWTSINVEGGINQYKYLYFVYAHNSGGEIYTTHLMKVEDFKNIYNNDSTNYITLFFYGNNKENRASFYYVDEYTINIKVNNSLFSGCVYGIK